MPGYPRRSWLSHREIFHKEFTIPVEPLHRLQEKSPMSTTEMEDFLILRTFDEPLSEDTFNDVVEHAGEVLETLITEGRAIHWIKSTVRSQANGAITGTVCQYRADSEGVLREHASRAGLPVTQIDIHRKTLERGGR